MSLSTRLQLSKGEAADNLKKYLHAYAADRYNEDTNPDGIINLGTAANGIHSEIVQEKLLSQKLDFGPNVYQYFPEHGTARLQKAMADFMTTFFETSEPVRPENVFIMTSTINTVDVIAHCLADPGDFFLCVSPVYGGILHGVETRSLVKLWPIHLSSHSDIPFNLTLEDVEVSYQKALKAGARVKGFILLNPGNPTGYVIGPDLLQDILQFCHRHELHFVSDEVYALSVHDPGVTFHSVLKLPSLPDPNRTHLLYGLGKDLGLTKLRMGVLHTFNSNLQKHLKRVANFHCVAYPVMEIAANILEDKEWCRSLFKKSRVMLRERYLFVAEKLENLGLEVHHTPAAIYLWVNFKKYCQPLTFESEELLVSSLTKKAKVVIYPGGSFGTTEPGWFRIVFTTENSAIQKGIQRLEEFLTNFENQEMA